MPIPVVTLAVVLVLIAVRRIGRLSLAIWQIVLAGAAVVLFTGRITPVRALQAIDFDVLIFLLGMFIVGEALARSGYLFQLSHRLFSRIRSTDGLLLAILFATGAGSAVLMNDTLAVIGTPLMLMLAREHDLDPKLLLLALAFAITTGSVVSPIGNPQNLLIAIHGGIENPFVLFARHLLPATLLNLLLTFLALRMLARNSLHGRPLVHAARPVRDAHLAALARWSLVLVLVLVTSKALTTTIPLPAEFRLTYIAAAALPLLLFSPRRLELLRHVDWSTLIFFAALFVLMQSVWDTGLVQSLMEQAGAAVATTPAVLGSSIIASQFISNVPLVALYLPVLQHMGAGDLQLVALAAGSTLAGNLFIFGAASNIIVIQKAERSDGVTLTFREFARVGIPLTCAQSLVVWLLL